MTRRAHTAHRSLIVASGLVLAVAAANVASSTLGLVPAVPGTTLLVSAGTFGAGVAIALRDVLHEVGGLRWVLGAISVGIGVSLLTGDGRVALASAMAFGLAELLDLAVYTPLRRRAWRTAVTASNAVGAVVDTFVFLSIAGFPVTTSTVTGQLLVKAVFVTAVFLALADIYRRALAPREVSAS